LFLVILGQALVVNASEFEENQQGSIFEQDQRELMSKEINVQENVFQLLLHARNIPAEIAKPHSWKPHVR